ncbi:hypothetical protein Anapl_00188 [Anas platyrhynchos]|uniref:Uncharacterized protein n=1 Tax=Anas platyrhynchos TaxID=8839 RepID=R0K2F5_ANAPL|nr:hypothetical protein Anapl_00188 [Anas platyrhynchos]
MHSATIISSSMMATRSALQQLTNFHDTSRSLHAMKLRQEDPELSTGELSTWQGPTLVPRTSPRTMSTKHPTCCTIYRLQMPLVMSVFQKGCSTLGFENQAFEGVKAEAKPAGARRAPMWAGSSRLQGTQPGKLTVQARPNRWDAESRVFRWDLSRARHVPQGSVSHLQMVTPAEARRLSGEKQVARASGLVLLEEKPSGKGTCLQVRIAHQPAALRCTCNKTPAACCPSSVIAHLVRCNHTYRSDAAAQTRLILTEPTERQAGKDHRPHFTDGQKYPLPKGVGCCPE